MNTPTIQRDAPENMRARLVDIIRERSFRDGVEITLASGRKSDFYVNMKPTMMHPEGAYLIASLFLDKISGDDVDLIGGLEMGAVPLAAAVAAVGQAQGRPVQGFFVRKKAKDHGTQSLVEGLAEGEGLAARRIVVLEDVTTTGGSALKAAEALKADGATVVCVITVVDRQEGAVETFEAAGMPFRALLTAQDLR
ncbi:MAG: orotate phosphoribosyltransferase [Hyphomicrobiaceae bacterium]